MFAALGAGVGDLTKAISVGAAVEVAQNRAKTQLSNYFLKAPTRPENGLRVLHTTLSELPAGEEVRN